MVSSLVDGAAMQGIWLPVCSDVMGEGWRVGGIAGTGFTCFTSTKVLASNAGAKERVARGGRGFHSAFTCFTNTRVQILTPAGMLQMLALQSEWQGTGRGFHSAFTCFTSTKVLALLIQKQQALPLGWGLPQRLLLLYS